MTRTIARTITNLYPMAEQQYPKPATSVRIWIILGLALASAAAYLTRTCIAAANTTITKDMGFDAATMGAIIAAFQIGYFMLQVPSGWLANRFGTRATLPLLSVLWSLCSLWSGMAHSASSLWWSRMCAGLAQAGLVPCSAKAVREWAPPESRGLASSAVATSMSIGGVIATGLTAGLLPHLGWRGVFIAYSSVGVVWAIAFYAGFRNRPEEHPAVNSSELTLIRGEQEKEVGEEVGEEAAEEVDEPAVPPREANRLLLLAMVTSTSMWAVCSQSFFRAFGAAFYQSWFPAFLEKSRHLHVTKAGFLAMLPLIGTVVGNFLGGPLVDRLLKATGNRRLSRCGTAVFALASCAVCTVASAWVGDPVLLVCVLALGNFFFGLGSPAAWAAAMDISGKHTALVFGIMNMSGNIGAWLCPILIGHMFKQIEQTGAGWNGVLFMVAGIFAAGAVSWALLNPHRSAVERGAC